MYLSIYLSGPCPVSLTRLRQTGIDKQSKCDTLEIRCKSIPCILIHSIEAEERMKNWGCFYI